MEVNHPIIVVIPMPFQSITVTTRAKHKWSHGVTFATLWLEAGNNYTLKSIFFLSAYTNWQGSIFPGWWLNCMKLNIPLMFILDLLLCIQFSGMLFLALNIEMVKTICRPNCFTVNVWAVSHPGIPLHNCVTSPGLHFIETMLLFCRIALLMTVLHPLGKL